MTLTASTVSRVLGAKHKRDESHGSRVRGYRTHTGGFIARGEGTVTVDWRPSMRYSTDAAEFAAQQATLASYVTTLTAAGLDATIVAPNGEGARHREIRVTRKAGA